MAARTRAGGRGPGHVPAAATSIVTGADDVGDGENHAISNYWRAHVSVMHAMRGSGVGTHYRPHLEIRAGVQMRSLVCQQIARKKIDSRVADSLALVVLAPERSGGGMAIVALRYVGSR